MMVMLFWFLDKVTVIKTNKKMKYDQSQRHNVR